MTALAEQPISSERNVRRADPDADDVGQAQAGSVEAFERLYRRHVAKINGLAIWMIGPGEADDTLQDIFVRAWEKLPTFRGDAAFGTWLHRLAVNVLLRRRQEAGTRNGRYVQDDSAIAKAPDRARNLQLRTDIETAIDKLPPRARDVFVLHDVEGYKHHEIAQILKISSGTSRSQLHDARMALRRHLA